MLIFRPPKVALNSLSQPVLLSSKPTPVHPVLQPRCTQYTNGGKKRRIHGTLLRNQQMSNPMNSVAIFQLYIFTILLLNILSLTSKVSFTWLLLPRILLRLLSSPTCMMLVSSGTILGHLFSNYSISHFTSLVLALPIKHLWPDSPVSFMPPQGTSHTG